MKNQEKQLKEIDKGIDQLNWWIILNTIFTILAGIATLAIAILTYSK